MAKIEVANSQSQFVLKQFFVFPEHFACAMLLTRCHQYIYLFGMIVQLFAYMITAVLLGFEVCLPVIVIMNIIIFLTAFIDS